jgi:inhibitor of cysteine peptidase
MSIIHPILLFFDKNMNTSSDAQWITSQLKWSGIILIVVMMVCWMVVALPQGANATTIDTGIIDTITQNDQNNDKAMMEEVKKQVTFNAFTSCDEMWVVMEKFIKDNKEYLRGYWWWWVMPMIREMSDDGTNKTTPSPQDGWKDAMANATSPVALSDWWSELSFSQTNIQVVGIDEPDILKQDGQYIYYYNDTLKWVYVLRIDPIQPTPTIMSIIAIPKDFYNTQLLLHKKTLVILAQRWRNSHTSSLIERSSKVHSIFYDINDATSPKLVKLTDYPWTLLDARLKDGKVTIINQVWVSHWRIAAYAEWNKKFTINPDELSPQQFDISYTPRESEQNLTIDNKRLPYRVTKIRIPCESIQYVFPSKDALERMWALPSFTTVYTLSVEQPTRVASAAALFGNTQTMYMSPNRLYLTQSLYTHFGFPCRDMARCVLPRFGAWEVTVVHAFDYKQNHDIDYTYSAIVEGNPLNQWSMDENVKGELRIITSKFSQQTNTHLSILSNTWTVLWYLSQIAPWEQFQASRYIGDTLYLVTFEAIDPLFVIDVAQSTAPKIIGELKIPWYSTYLHPYSQMQSWVQYLVWIWYDTLESHRGWVINWWIKIDLYKADFISSSWWVIPVTQEATRTLWSEWSFTQAQTNPRTFVWNAQTKELTLPLVLSETEKSQSCTVRYSASWVEIYRECYPHTDYKVTFVWLKRYEITPENGIKENLSRDYLSYYTPKFNQQTKEGWSLVQMQWESVQPIQPWFFHARNARGGYTQWKPFIITNDFVDAFKEGNEKTFTEFLVNTNE